ncbi:MAG: lipoyl synthase [Candidatus Omnitrophica bacterium CG1_02_44_16]|nr:MAG: lipoyl synthase [Candidatus Omnitrophica bacterium CG1_02_44_16]PIY82632.1 MAG: lipoyl synthase [Candidatus Omnitrophica bacterium CG_4_10_14_0_8_um_filter_44_12]PIZ84014.1 MAG: lipoyl synthase [Candidatus Omnitrophica bacterium CG_4_10_14_0_2_um_filter_44_9]
MPEQQRRPEWLKKKIEFNNGSQTSALLNGLGLNTVCREAKCPNISECYKNAHAAFLILGRYCTRDCSFCNVEKQEPLALDPKEPARVALAVAKMGLKHVVITSVTRDDLSDGGAQTFVDTVKEIKKASPDKKIMIELLIPDLLGDTRSLETLASSLPDIIAHNLETVPRLYNFRPKANYARSLFVLKHVKITNPKIRTKSALILGLGEKEKEVTDVLEDLRMVDCDFLALGQYLQPSLKHTKVTEYITPDQFSCYKKLALRLGFKHVESGPYVRSSFLAASYLA